VSHPFLARLERGPILADGAMGTLLYERGIPFDRSFDLLNLTDPAVVQGIHRDYIRAGADVVSTNTFQLARRSYANHFADREHMHHIGARDIETRAPILISEGVARALEARDETRKQDVCVAGAMTTASAASARRMWPISDSCVRSNVSVLTGFPDSVCRVSGVMNRWPPVDIITRTLAPARVRPRTSSAAL